MTGDAESLVRMARFGKAQGKRNVIADLGPLCELVDEVERLRAELAAAKAEPPRPAAIVACPSKSARGYMVHQFEDFEDEDVMRVSRHLADEVSFPIHVFKVTDFIWHPKKST